MSKSLVLTMTPQLGLTSQNPSAYYWRPTLELTLGLGIDLWTGVKYQSNQNIFEIHSMQS